MYVICFSFTQRSGSNGLPIRIVSRMVPYIIASKLGNKLKLILC